jgi:hypothetical protein
MEIVAVSEQRWDRGRWCIGQVMVFVHGWCLTDQIVEANVEEVLVEEQIARMVQVERRREECWIYGFYMEEERYRASARTPRIEPVCLERFKLRLKKV